MIIAGEGIFQELLYCKDSRGCKHMALPCLSGKSIASLIETRRLMIEKLPKDLCTDDCYLCGWPMRDHGYYLMEVADA